MAMASWSDEETPIAGGSRVARQPYEGFSFLTRWSVADWAAALFIAAVGLHLDKGTPFQRKVGPQAHDPTISYPHTPLHLQQVPVDLLWTCALYLPLAALVLVAVACPLPSRSFVPSGSFSRAADRIVLVNEAVLGLFSSLATTLTFVCIVKNAVGRLRPDCAPTPSRVCVWRML